MEEKKSNCKRFKLTIRLIKNKQYVYTKKSISKDKIKYNVELELTEKIVQKLINLNCQKSCINDITVSQVKFLIKKWL